MAAFCRCKNPLSLSDALKTLVTAQTMPGFLERPLRSHFLSLLSLSFFLCVHFHTLFSLSYSTLILLLHFLSTLSISCEIHLKSYFPALVGDKLTFTHFSFLLSPRFINHQSSNSFNDRQIALSIVKYV